MSPVNQPASGIPNELRTAAAGQDPVLLAGGRGQYSDRFCRFLDLVLRRRLGAALGQLPGIWHRGFAKLSAQCSLDVPAENHGSQSQGVCEFCVDQPWLSGNFQRNHLHAPKHHFAVDGKTTGSRHRAGLGLPDVKPLCFCHTPTQRTPQGWKIIKSLSFCRRKQWSELPGSSRILNRQACPTFNRSMAS